MYCLVPGVIIGCIIILFCLILSYFIASYLLSSYLSFPFLYIAYYYFTGYNTVIDAIIGGVVAGGSLLIFSLVIMCYCCCCRKRTVQNPLPAILTNDTVTVSIFDSNGIIQATVEDTAPPPYVDLRPTRLEKSEITRPNCDRFPSPSAPLQY